MIAASRIASRAFIGRQPELAFLHDALATDDPDDPRGVFVGGDAGIGKTRLVTQFVSRCARREGPPSSDRASGSMKRTCPLLR